MRLWLKLFDAETEKELSEIEALGVPIMNQAIGAYRNITVTEEFRTLERMRTDARHNEAAALHNARNEGLGGRPVSPLLVERAMPPER